MDLTTENLFLYFNVKMDILVNLNRVVVELKIPILNLEIEEKHFNEKRETEENFLVSKKWEK